MDPLCQICLDIRRKLLCRKAEIAVPGKTGQKCKLFPEPLLPFYVRIRFPCIPRGTARKQVEHGIHRRVAKVQSGMTAADFLHGPFPRCEGFVFLLIR